MRGITASVALVLVAVAVAGVVSVVPSIYPADDSAFSLQFVRTGGYAGVNDTLAIDERGAVTYSSRFGQSFNATLTQSELSDLRHVLTTSLGSIQSSALHPRSGVADFFSYGLTVTMDGKTTHLSWVDEWATLEPFPSGLQAVQQTLQGIIQTPA